MRIQTLLRYLIGDRQAVLETASDRRAVLYGFLFVLSAGFAREYDGQDLLHEPWHLFLPLGVSLLTSFVLFTLFYGVALLKGAPGPSFFVGYRSFLGLFWMTAPLAWLYAIPYERFLSAGDATAANLSTLGLVATWRVLLISRVLSVLLGYHLLTALCVVLAFGDTLALIAIAMSPLEILNLMGGIHFTESQQVITSTGETIAALGGCSLPFWIAGSIPCLIVSKPAWQASLQRSGAKRPISHDGLLYLALASLAIWAVLLPYPQMEQQLRRRVEFELRDGHIDVALAIMSEHSQEDFPPHWDLPPQLGFQDDSLSMVDFFEGMVRKKPASWVQRVYFKKLRAFLDWSYDLNEDEVSRVVQIMKQLPEGPETIQQWKKRPRYKDNYRKYWAGEDKKEEMEDGIIDDAH
jgi:hypothetical protein